jgi:hypothetical protein
VWARAVGKGSGQGQWARCVGKGSGQGHGMNMV